MTALQELRAGVDVETIYSAPFGAELLEIVHEARASDRTVLFVVSDDRRAQAAAQIAEFYDPALEILRLTAWDNLPYDRVSPTAAVASRRCAALAALAQDSEPKARLVITTSAAIAQRCAPKETLKDASLALKPGQIIAQDTLDSFLIANGYTRVPTVRDRGEYAQRGGIVDIFAPGEPEPVRLDFFGDALESLRCFDPETQLSTRQLKSVEFSPVSEIFFTDEALSRFRTKFIETFGPPAGDPMFEAARSKIRRQGIENWLPLFHDHLDTVFDYLPDGAIIAFDPNAIESAKEKFAQAEDYFQAREHAAGNKEDARVLAPGALYIPWKEAEKHLAQFPSARFSPRDTDPGAGHLSLDVRAARDFGPERAQNQNVFDAVISHIRSLRERGDAVLLGAWSDGSADRLINVLNDHGLESIQRTYSIDGARSAGLAIAELPLDAGFELEGLSVLSEQDILGERISRPRKRRKAANFIAEAASLTPGDLVVHVEHGVGVYKGLVTVEVSGAPHACLELHYHGGDKLLLPVENIELVSRYGSDGGEGVLDKLGGTAWQSRKARAKKRIMEMADGLIKIAAERALRKGVVIDEGQGVYEEFSARFPYEETEDQLRAIEECLGDLASGKPMDRLICGDVGFGKTEVALRTAFVAAMSGVQVAIIAPTTLLARQHYQTFKDRLAGWPLKVGQLSRLVTTKEANLTREGLKTGSIDIVVGTHAVLAKNVDFQNLGLLVIDEEQRFGVKHKERLKEMKSGVHVLTLSATPIPRTLQMALTGIRELSIIATPPVDRLSVRTYVTEFDMLTIREALLRERYRGGQAFIVAPRVKDLPELERFLKEHVPEVSFITAHGQMAAGELDEIMTDFYDGKYDVLLSTTIVEAGLDIPRANTLILYRADMFGLAQMYQLRGRVGRSKLRAYAYFTTPKDKMLTDSAEKRLKVLQSLDSLGAGFMLASHDLDMRGGGNLLGDQQSGHIREVGVELYQNMLEDAVKALQQGGEDFEDDWSPQINLGLAALIPEDYVADLGTRMSLYRRLADVENNEDREAFAAELIDRFGPLPDETVQLLDIASIKAACKTLGIAKLDAGPKGAVFAFRDKSPVEPGKLVALVQKRPNQLKLRPDFKLVLSASWNNATQKARGVRQLLGQLQATLD
ncbi:transcription-repair coupling factor [Ponticaulis sp.]|uniref:transcription-repair coupling factor n=1 Tax=Ponticaulis sp. TaxID=2020902 RepID=UPI000C4A7383|nr:transcription-repair coupling factor [Ponticaulis sp.]MAF58874.1 transcription-repair coupling factor [Ponticaulis sp.]MBN04751.1 transcription-repair coupling factor [Ponticaulis sp.]